MIVSSAAPEHTETETCPCSAYYGAHPRQDDCYPLCKVCSTVWRARYAWFCVVSPNGVAHIGKDDGDTVCGKDARGDAWRWPE